MALNGKIENLIIEFDKKFGAVNPVSTFYRFLRLSNFLYQNIWDENSVREFKTSLENFHSILFSNTKKKNFDYSIEAIDGKIYYKFPRNKFDDLYKEFICNYENDFSSNLLFDFNHRFLHNRFIYIIDSELRFNYYLKPQPMDNFLIGNKDVKIFPFHPMLAIQSDLKVFCAGELSFYWKKEDEYPIALYINNISGHYMPTTVSSDELNITIRKILKLPNSCSIISFTNEGVKISGKLKDKLKLNE